LDADSNDDGYTDYQDYTGQLPPGQPLDTDGDGLSDDDESSLGTSITDADSDDDHLQDAFEVGWGSNPLALDTDGDGLDDDVEYASNLPPTDDDADDDGLLDGYEVATSLTNPASADTDEDGLNDGHEVNISYTDPLLKDTDQDHLTDYEEVNGTDLFPAYDGVLNPTDFDSDDDQVPDFLEVAAYFADTDGGGIPDRIELFYQLDPGSPYDDDGNLDGDSWTNEEEYLAGHSLNGNFTSEYDWDSDGMSNVWEIHYGLDPRDHRDAANDQDGDWMLNREEYQAQTNPLDAISVASGISNPMPSGAILNGTSGSVQWAVDWDSDGTSNLDEVLNAHTDPREAPPPPDPGPTPDPNPGPEPGPSPDPTPSPDPGPTGPTYCTCVNSGVDEFGVSRGCTCGSGSCSGDCVAEPYSCGCGGPDCGARCTETSNCGSSGYCDDPEPEPSCEE
jgi:hypothetical protein